MNPFARGVRIQARCLSALMTRQMMMRYGRDNLGFLWVFVEPMLLCAGVMLVWSAIRSPYEHGVSVLSFVLTGYLPLTLWRHITNSGIYAFRNNITLLYHRHVTLFDIFFTRVLLEFIGTTTAFLMVSLTLILVGVLDVPKDMGLVISGWLTMAAFSVGVAVWIAVATEYSEIWDKFIPVLQYLSLPISGCFFMIDWLPSSAQRLIWYMPTVHCYEMVRGGFYGTVVPTYFDPWYPLVFGLLLFASGISMIEKTKNWIHV